MEKSPSAQMRFNYRSFVAAGLTLAVCILPVSGIMNHQLQLFPMTSERHFWMAVHNMTGVVFVIFLLAHIGLNRRALWMYISAKRGAFLNKELLAALVLVAVPVVLFALHAFHVR